MSTELHAVTGAFGFSGRYIARNLLDRGRNVITLTNSLHRPNPFGESVKAYPFNFDKPEKLTESLSGVSVLYNTYWVRFNYKTFGYSTAIQNTFALFEAAKKAGVKRIVHTSITNPSESSPYEYFRDKAIIEKNLIESGISYAILRPAVLFGKEGILINNIAWALRKFPYFSIFGDGNYRLQPIYVDDFAKLAAEQGEKSENTIINAIGPETFSYRELIEEIGSIIGKKRPFISVPPAFGYFFALIIGKFVHDVMLTKDEIKGLMDNLLYVDAPPAGKTKLTEWVRENADILGSHYESELARRKK
ncbi:NAD-dependent epimerase/dehydratase family protein [Candidatus Kuenenia sp.]|uniref:SDR family oxidoreductase n=1 Tax=Candidatus Kuenenia sp. TaxID=2499824 RepID=UPI0032203A60